MISKYIIKHSYVWTPVGYKLKWTICESSTDKIIEYFDKKIHAQWFVDGTLEENLMKEREVHKKALARLHKLRCPWLY